MKVSGDAWDIEGKKIARFWSKAVAVDQSEQKLFYYWEGEHPYHLDTPRFFGVGEIFWESDMMHASPTLQGWFSVYPLEKLDSSMRKSTEYRLATEAETQIVNGVDKSALKKLINDKVRERNLIRE